MASQPTSRSLDASPAPAHDPRRNQPARSAGDSNARFGECVLQPVQEKKSSSAAGEPIAPSRVAKQHSWLSRVWLRGRGSIIELIALDAVSSFKAIVPVQLVFGCG